MNKADLVSVLAERSGLYNKQATALLDDLADVVQAQLATGGEVTLPGIGKLAVTERAERTGRNPQTGEAITIPARKAPKFTPASRLKEAANG